MSQIVPASIILLVSIVALMSVVASIVGDE